MRILYHGTDSKSARNIQHKGFKPGTYFSQHLEDALYYGGEYIFEVLFEQDPPDYWEYTCPKKVPVSRILRMYTVAPTLRYQNPRVERRIALLHLQDENPKYSLCRACEGRGQVEDYPPFAPKGVSRTRTLCPKCRGHGSVEKMIDMDTHRPISEHYRRARKFIPEFQNADAEAAKDDSSTDR